YYATKSIEVAPKITSPFNNSSGQTRAALRLALAYRQLGQFAKSTEWLQKGLEIAKKIPAGAQKNRFEAILHNELGVDLLRNGAIEEAINNMSYSLQLVESELAQRRRNRSPRENILITMSWVLTIADSLGNAYLSAGNSDQAIDTYQRGLGHIQQSKITTQLEGSFYRGLGQAFLGKKDFARAREHLTKALEIAERARDGIVIQQASSDLGDLLRLTQKPAEAIPYYKKAIEIIESTRSLLQSEELRSGFFEDKRQTYTGMIVAHLDEKKVEEAFTYSERARSRAFLDILGSKVQLSRSGSLLEHERALQARISVLQAMMGGQEPDSVQTPQLGKELTEAQQDYNDFLVKVRKENKEQASLMNVEPLTLKQVQELLAPGVAVLEYFVTAREVLLWVVEKDRAHFVNIPISRTDLVAKVTALRDTIHQLSEKDRFNNLSQELYRLLIEPVLPHIRGKEL
ncbi:MAG: tetratricopeptide repeat protein, partial [Terriglobia bacterium]